MGWRRNWQRRYHSAVKTRANREKQGTGLIMAVLAAALYIAGYFLLSDYEFEPGTISAGPLTATGVHQRTFDSQWFSAAYEPLGWVEGKLRGEPVWLCYLGDFEDVP
jgi:hypothetical protein